MMTPAQAEAARVAHDNAVWQAISTSGEGNPPSSAAGAATAAAMNAERQAQYAFGSNPNTSTEAAFIAAYNNTAARFQAWKGRAIGTAAAASNLTSSSSPGGGAAGAGIGVGALVVGGLALWWLMRKKKGGKGGKKKLLGIL